MKRMLLLLLMVLLVFVASCKGTESVESLQTEADDEQRENHFSVYCGETKLQLNSPIELQYVPCGFSPGPSFTVANANSDLDVSVSAGYIMAAKGAQNSGVLESKGATYHISNKEIIYFVLLNTEYIEAHEPINDLIETPEALNDYAEMCFADDNSKCCVTFKRTEGNNYTAELTERIDVDINKSLEDATLQDIIVPFYLPQTLTDGRRINSAVSWKGDHATIGDDEDVLVTIRYVEIDDACMYDFPKLGEASIAEGQNKITIKMRLSSTIGCEMISNGITREELIKIAESFYVEQGPPAS